jgi:hypothetical protein
VHGDDVNWAFYTDTSGSDDQGRWILEQPTVLRSLEGRRSEQRVSPGPDHGLTLQVPGSGPCPIVDLSPGGLAFQCDFMAGWAQNRQSLMAEIQVPGVGGVPVWVQINHLRMDPAGNRTRLAGARITCLDEIGQTWWRELIEGL